MQIQIIEKTNSLVENNWFEKVISTLEGLECSDYLNGLTELNQSEQKIKVLNFQEYILEHLKTYHSDFKWETEYQVGVHRDSVDIFGERNNEVILIELDKWRADQVAKKLISRTALMIDKKFGFISLCYSGTAKMNRNECFKFFKYGKIILSKLGNYYSGMIIE